MDNPSPEVIAELRGLLEKATPLLIQCIARHEHAADLASQFQAATELRGGDGTQHERDRIRETESADTLRALHTALPSLLSDRARMAEMEWQDIATAPKDGTEILACGPYMGRECRFVALWNGIEWYAGWGNAIQPTRWTPLPAALTTATRGEEG